MALQLEENPERKTSVQDHFGILKFKLQSVISNASENAIQNLLDALAEMDFDIVTPPESGLLMMNIEESNGDVFHLGEVLVTQTEIKQNGRTGYGCCMGDRPEAAMALACLDALSRHESTSAPVDRIQEEIDRIVDSVTSRRNRESRMAALTRVDFRSMAEE